MARVRSHREGFTLIELLVVVAIIAILVTLLLPAVQKVRDSALKTSCSSQLRQVVIAMHSWESSNRRLPGERAAKPARWSMFVDILPQIEQNALYNRLNFEIAGPNISAIAATAGAVNSNMSTTTPFTFNTTATTEWVAPTGATGAGPHRLAMFTKLAAYQCPIDQGPTSVLTGINYVPIVTANGGTAGTGGARMVGGALLEALWPGTGGEGVSGNVPATAPTWAPRMNPPNLGGIPDGSGNTIGIVERVKGINAGGRTDPKNQAFTGTGFGFMVQGGSIPDQASGGTQAGDNRTAVNACRAAQTAGTPMTGGGNDASGLQWIQYTCAWMGCANTMAPPNSAVCGVSGQEFAEAGSAPPSSYHTGGANCGFMDGATKFLTDSVDLKVFHALGTSSGGEAVKLPD